MTTESKQDTRQVHPAGVSPLLGASVAGAVTVIALSVVAALVDGGRGLAGAAAGGVLTLVVFVLGIGLVNLAARVLPAASLLVALLTYTLQLLVLALAVVALERSGVAGEDLSRGWFAASVIAVTVLWLLGQVVAATKQRIPAFDLTSDDHPGGER
jgi:ATP synthase protein I